MKVYIFGHPDGFYKIGRSINPEERLSTAETWSPYELTMETQIKSHIKRETDGSLETALHRYYENYHVKGEWFKLPEEEVESLHHIGRLSSDVVNQLRSQYKPHPSLLNIPLGELIRDMSIYKYNPVE